MKQVHVVPHSHWDREWYFTIEDSNAMLVEHLDFLVNYLEQNEDYPYFVFDGQISIVEEYLKYRPEMEARLNQLIADERIAVGPWYTQCDSFNPKIESVVRNLQYGIHIGNKYGKIMKVGYLPDAFGQNSYLPSIFKNCNLDYSVLQRGVETKDAKNGLSFKWVSPNGETINSNYIYFGYGPGKFLETGEQYLSDKLMPMLDTISEMSNDDSILLPSGGDQALIRTHFKDTVKELNTIQDDYQFELSNYELFMDSQSFDNEISGELYTPEKARIHRTIHSQRMDFKILNNQVEKLLIENLEPLTVVAKKLGIQTNQLLVDEMWKAMFDVHAHDSIGGCNSDDTNKRIVARLNEVKAKAEGQINIITKKIAKASLGKNNGIVAFNFSNKTDKLIKARIFSNTKGFAIVDSETNVELLSFEQTLVDGGTKIEVTAEGERQVKLPGYYQTDVEFKLDGLAYGYKTLEIKELESELDYEETEVKSNQISTAIYSLELNDEVTITANNKTVKLGFEIESDLGDSYDFAFDPTAKPKVITKITNLKVIETKSYYHANFNSQVTSPNNKQLTIETKIKISKTEDDLQINHSFINTATDYRLRTLFITEVESDTHTADSGYGMITRNNIDPYLNEWKEQRFAEMPLAIYPFERFVKVDNLSIINSNVKEYQVVESGLALTLVRAVGYLGRDDLSTRPGRASGINNVVVYTPDAQMSGHHFEICYNLSLVCNAPYSYYAKATDNTICYQNQSLNLFENRLERFELPISSVAPKSLNIELPANLEISSSRVSLDGNIEYTMLNNGESVDISALNTYDFVGNKLTKETVMKNDYVIFRENNE